MAFVSKYPELNLTLADELTQQLGDLITDAMIAGVSPDDCIKSIESICVLGTGLRGKPDETSPAV